MTQSIDSFPLYESENKSVRGEQALWRAVLLQVITDAKNNVNKRQARREKETAIAWLTESRYAADFYAVCELAGMCPDTVRSMVKQAAARDFVWRKPARKGKETMQEFIGTKRICNQFILLPLDTCYVSPLMQMRMEDWLLKHGGFHAVTFDTSAISKGGKLYPRAIVYQYVEYTEGMDAPVLVSDDLRRRFMEQCADWKKYDLKWGI